MAVGCFQGGLLMYFKTNYGYLTKLKALKRKGFVDASQPRRISPPDKF